MSNWKNLERDLEMAEKKLTPDTPDHIYPIRAAYLEWPGMMTIIRHLIRENRRLNKEVESTLGRLQDAHERLAQ